MKNNKLEELDLENCSLAELKNLKKTISESSTYGVKLSYFINIKEGEELNKKIIFDEYDLIPKTEKEILDYNNIKNMYDLKKQDLNKLTYPEGGAIGEGTKEFFRWARKMYDMTPLALQKKVKAKSRKSG